jgi:hypothetical protein
VLMQRSPVLMHELSKNETRCFNSTWHLHGPNVLLSRAPLFWRVGLSCGLGGNFLVEFQSLFLLYFRLLN